MELKPLIVYNGNKRGRYSMDIQRPKDFKPRLRYGDQIFVMVRKRVAGRCFRSEREILEALEYAYREKIKRKRKMPVQTKNRLRLQVMFKSGRTVECAYMEVGIKGYYVRYTKVKRLKWRDKKKGYRQPYSGPDTREN